MMIVLPLQPLICKTSVFFNATRWIPSSVVEAQPTPASALATTSQAARGDSILGFAPFDLTAAHSDARTDIYESYRYPTMCVTAALREEDRAQRTPEAQQRQMIRRPDTLSLPLPTVRTAAACSAHWSVATTPAFELPAFFRLALMAQHDAFAHAAGDAWQQDVNARDTISRAERLLRLLQWASETRPRTDARRHTIAQYLSALHALGPAAREEQIDGENISMQLAGLAGEFATELAIGDTLRQTIRSLPSATLRDRFSSEMLNAALAQSTVVFTLPVDFTSAQFHKSIDQGLALARHDLDTVDSQRHIRFIIPTTFNQYVFGMERVRHIDDPGHDSLVVGLYVHPAPKLVAQHWFRRPDTAAAYPRPGVPTVIIPADVCDDDDCYKIYAEYRRLYETFAPKGVDFILVAKTQGSFGLSTLLPPQAEVDSLRAYYLDHLKLPGILAIEETHFTTLADGRRSSLESANAGLGYSLVARDGMVWEGGMSSSASIAQTEAFIINHLLPTPSNPPH